MQGIIKTSGFLKAIRENGIILAAGLLLAAVSVFIFYPGVFYSDSYRRVELAYTLADGVLEGRQMWLTPAPSYFMAICLKLTGNIGFYSFLQAFAYYTLSMLFIKRISRRFRLVQYLLFVLNPAFFCVAIYYEAGIGCLCGIYMLMLVFFSGEYICNRLDLIAAFFLVLLGTFITFGYRANALTILPILIFMVFIFFRERIRRCLFAGIILAGLFLVFLIPKILKIDTMSSISTSFVWEIVSTIQSLDDEKKKEYWDCLDEISYVGATFDAVMSNSDRSVGVWLWSDGLGYQNLSKEGAFSIVIEKYLWLAKREPKALLKNKLHSIRFTLGYRDELDIGEWQYNLNGAMEAYGFSDTSVRQLFFQEYPKAVSKQKIWTRPWLLFLMSIIFLAVYKAQTRWFKDKNSCKAYGCILLVSAFYYGAFFINTQAYEVRYFFPSASLMILMDVAIICNLLYNSVLHMRKERNGVCIQDL